MRKVFSMLAILLLCFSLPVTARADTVSSYSVVPYFEVTDNAYLELVIKGTSATCESSVKGEPNVVTITAEQYLQKQGFLWIWSTYDDAEWTKAVNASSLLMTNTKSGLTSGKYRLKTIFTLTDSTGKGETITIYSDEKTVS